MKVFSRISEENDEKEEKQHFSLESEERNTKEATNNMT